MVIPALRMLFPWLAAILVSGGISVGVVEGTRLTLESDYKSLLTTEVTRRAIDVTAQTLNGNIMGSVMALGLVNRTVKAVVTSTTPPMAMSAQESLAAIGTSYQASGVFLVNQVGTIVVSWDKNGASMVGMDIKFRPYFQIALQGRQSIFAAVSIATGERALYFSAPIFNDISSNAPVIGAVVARLDLERVDSVLNAWTGPALLLSPQKVTFASNRSDWVLAMSGLRTPDELNKLRALKQFGKSFETGTPEILPFSIDSDQVTLDGHRYESVRAPVQWKDPNGDWSLVLLGDLDAVMPHSKMFELGGITFLVVFSLCALFIGWRHRLEQANLSRVRAEQELTAYTEKLERESEIKTYLAGVSADLHKAVTLSEFAQTFIRHAAPKLGADYAAFYVLNEEGGMLDPVGGYGVLPGKLDPVAIGQGLVGQCAQDKTAIALSDATGTPIRIVWGNGTVIPRHVLLSPVAQAEHVLGVLVIATINPLDQDQRTVLERMLPMAAMNLEILGRNLGTQRQADVLRKQQTQLAETEVWYRGIIESAPDGMLVMDEHGSIILTNPQLERMFGYEPGDLLGRKIEVLVPVDIRPRHIGFRDDFLKSGHTRPMGGQNLELRGVKKDNTEFPVEVGLSMLPAMGGHGLCVCATVRIRTQGGGGLVKASAPSVNPLTAIAGARILFVDDNALTQQVTQEFLTDAGLLVDLADNGQIAVEKVHATEYDLILMDMEMPVMNGIAAAAEIRNHGFTDLPIIAMTANDRQVDRDACASAGMNDFLTKPIDYGALSDMVLRWVSSHTHPSPKAVSVGVAFSVPDLDPDIFDFEKLGPIYHWDKGKLQGAVAGFLGDAQAKVAALESAHGEGDSAAIRQVAHALKGSGNTAGALRLGTLAANVEDMALSGNSEALTLLIPLLTSTLTELSESLSPFLTSSH